MSQFTLFMKQNKISRPNVKYPASSSLCDKNGKPLEWELKHISSKENDRLRDECTSEIPVAGKSNMYRPKLNAAKYIGKLIAASVVYPDLYDAELQDSYGVKSPEELLYELVDDPGEYSELAAYVQKLQGFDISLEEKADRAKN
ncbi:MAG: hypothetical protein HDT46_04850 [Ruminococcaceae bacterium]|nr:hypothetical protein [Oscillospiraceae bacterium]